MWIIRFFLWIIGQKQRAMISFGGAGSHMIALPRPAGLTGLKESAKGESPTAPLVMEMARVVIGQKGDDTSIITPNLDSVSARCRAIS
jgi:hypothetical protein